MSNCSKLTVAGTMELVQHEYKVTLKRNGLHHPTF